MVIVTLGVINILDSSFRLYIIIAVMLGVIDFSKCKDKLLHKKSFLKLFKQKKNHTKEVNEYGTEKV